MTSLPDLRVMLAAMNLCKACGHDEALRRNPEWACSVCVAYIKAAVDATEGEEGHA